MENFDFVKLLLCLIIFCFVIKDYLVPALLNISGDALIELLPGKRGQAVKVKEEGDRLDFTVEIPYVNNGTDEGVILDAYMRIYLPQEQYDDVLLRGKVNLTQVLREDDYFEAVLAPCKKEVSLLLRFEAYAKNGKSIKEALTNVPDVDVAVMLDSRGRKELYTERKYFTLTAEEMRKLVQ